MKTTTWLRAGLWMAAVAAMAPLDVPAQESDEPQGRIGCFSLTPMPRCKTSWIVEMQGSVPMVQSQRTVSYGSGQTFQQEAFPEEEISWNLGHMVHLDPQWAVGGLFTVGSGGGDALTGVRLRVRRWVLPDLSVEAEGGLLRSNANGTRYPDVTGPTAGLRLNIRNHGSFFLQWDGLDLPPQTQDWGPDAFYRDPGGWQNGFRVGASLNSVAALAGSGVLTLAYAFLWAAYSDYD